MNVAKLIATALLSAVVGGILGAAVYAVAFDGGVSPDRGALLRLPGPIESYHDIDTTPFCIALQHFCLIRLKSGEVKALLYVRNSSLFRQQSCEIPWRPDFTFTDPATGESSTGWFRANCSGTTYRYDGERVFGPGPRDMDQFPVRETSQEYTDSEGTPYIIDFVEVDTRHLICGDTHGNGAATTCEKAPAPQWRIPLYQLNSSA